jgi:hypothetical protein
VGPASPVHHSLSRFGCEQNVIWHSTRVHGGTSVQTPRLIYLDLNHWIGLFKARTGHPDGRRYDKLYSHCNQGRYGQDPAVGSTLL